jgi:hypothetical protein
VIMTKNANGVHTSQRTTRRLEDIVLLDEILPLVTGVRSFIRCMNIALHHERDAGADALDGLSLAVSTLDRVEEALVEWHSAVFNHTAAEDDSAKKEETTYAA